MRHFHHFKPLIKFCQVTVVIAVLTLALHAAPAFASGNCLQDETPFHANCTANDVSIAQAVNIRDLNGKPLSTCFAGSTFSFLADFQVVTTATARENIGLYMATGGQSSALTGQCADNIISPPHIAGQQGGCTTPGSDGCLGSALYHEFDTSLPGDNCGDTTSADGTNQFITIEVDNMQCPTTGTSVPLPNCTSWQQPGGANVCISNTGPSNDWPWVPAAIPGSPSKCNCATISLPITPITYSISATKTPNPVSLEEPGGTFTYTVGVTNNTTLGGSFGSVTINQICDDKFGTIAQASGFSGSPCPAGTVGTASNVNCPLPQMLAVNGGTLGTCTFHGAFTPGTEGSLTDTVTVKGNGASGAPVSAQAHATVMVSEAPAAAAVIKSLDSVRECATARYKVEVDNNGGTGTDESETLSALTDSAYGNISAVQGNVLGTTCGVASGQGTLTGSSGAGALPATLNVGGKYICEFDGEFCAGLGPHGSCPTGLEQTDTITPTLTGDETGQAVSVDASLATLTVDECFTHTP
jgi:hypothetical protein